MLFHRPASPVADPPRASRPCVIDRSIANLSHFKPWQRPAIAAPDDSFPHLLFFGHLRASPPLFSSAISLPPPSPQSTAMLCPRASILCMSHPCRSIADHLFAFALSMQRRPSLGLAHRNALRRYPVPSIAGARPSRSEQIISVSRLFRTFQPFALAFPTPSILRRSYASSRMAKPLPRLATRSRALAMPPHSLQFESHAVPFAAYLIHHFAARAGHCFPSRLAMRIRSLLSRGMSYPC